MLMKNSQFTSMFIQRLIQLVFYSLYMNIFLDTYAYSTIRYGGAKGCVFPFLVCKKKKKTTRIVRFFFPYF